MTFKDALDVIGHKLFYRLLFPNWALRWGTPGMRRFYQAYADMEVSFSRSLWTLPDAR